VQGPFSLWTLEEKLGERRNCKEETAKKNAKDVRKSLMTLLSPQFENELEVDDIENMRCQC
jgi:hypothetical protein